jgi:hypothetical protein
MKMSIIVMGLHGFGPVRTNKAFTFEHPCIITITGYEDDVAPLIERIHYMKFTNQYINEIPLIDYVNYNEYNLVLIDGTKNLNEDNLPRIVTTHRCFNITLVYVNNKPNHIIQVSKNSPLRYDIIVDQNGELSITSIRQGSWKGTIMDLKLKALPIVYDFDAT